MNKAIFVNVEPMYHKSVNAEQGVSITGRQLRVLNEQILNCV